MIKSMYSKHTHFVIDFQISTKLIRILFVLLYVKIKSKKMWIGAIDELPLVIRRVRYKKSQL